MPSKIISGLEILRQHFHFKWLGLLSGELAVDLHEQKGVDSGRWVHLQGANSRAASGLSYRKALAPGGQF